MPHQHLASRSETRAHATDVIADVNYVRNILCLHFIQEISVVRCNRPRLLGCNLRLERQILFFSLTHRLCEHLRAVTKTSTEYPTSK